MLDSEKRIASKYKRIRDVTEEECYVGGKNCGSCGFRWQWDSKWRWFDHDYCGKVPVESN